MRNPDEKTNQNTATENDAMTHCVMDVSRETKKNIPSIHFTIGCINLSRPDRPYFRKILKSNDKRMSDFFSAHPLKGFSKEPQLEGFQGTWQEMSEMKPLDRMLHQDTAPGTLRSRMSYDLHPENSNNWSGYMAKRIFGKTTPAFRNRAHEIIEAMKENGYDSQAIREITEKPEAVKFLIQAIEAGKLPTLEDRPSEEYKDNDDAPNMAFDSDYEKFLEEIEAGTAPNSAVAAFALGKEESGTLRKPLDMLLNEIKTLTFQGLTNLAKKLMGKDGKKEIAIDWRYAKLSNKEQEAVWTVYRIYKAKRAPRHTDLGSRFITKARLLATIGKLTDGKKKEIRSSLRSYKLFLNKIDTNTLWDIVNEKKPKTKKVWARDFKVIIRR